ncbi:MAG: deoxyribose-phosphate aldolase [Candidatus Bipolaricaulota bacterium]|nr:deoxyribose-phosphate aldolase [Candidatus Bipolaricaulota bacterium]
MHKRELAKMIDHTLLGPTALMEGVGRVCAEAKKHGFASVCINPCYVTLAHELLQGTGVRVCTVIGFPHGMNETAVKAFEAEHAIADGAEELDMVINIAALKTGDYERAAKDIKAVCAARDKAPPGVLIKVILETALLGPEKKVAGAILAKASGADFVKTSTGFGPGGATVEDVALLRRTVGEQFGVKAAGGIRDYDAALAMIEAGATRIGASHSIDIIEGVPE